MTRSQRRRFSAQSMVEFALVAPIFFLLLFGVIELGRLVWTNHELANGTREGARLAMVRGSESSSPITSPGLIETRVLESTSGLNDADLTVSGTGLGGEPGTTVTITSTYQFDVLFGMIPGLSDFTMTHTSSVIIQH